MLVRSSRSEVFATAEDDLLLSNLHLKQSSTKIVNGAVGLGCFFTAVLLLLCINLVVH